MIDWNEVPDGDNWELFCRDFLSELGFVIEVDPARGPDGGQDLIVIERLSGKLGARQFRWLVSCKHYAGRGAAVGTGDEANILDRVAHHNADGFLGFYSTQASAALMERLRQLVNDGRVKQFEIFDHRKIEGHFVTAGLGKVALRYFPQSYIRLRPIQDIGIEYAGLPCDICGTDLLKKSIEEPYSGNVVMSHTMDAIHHHEEVFFVCKGECDALLGQRLQARERYTVWEDISDLCNPLLYLRNLVTYMNSLRSQEHTFSDEAHEKLKHLYIALAQRTLRDMSEEDVERFRELVAMEPF